MNLEFLKGYQIRFGSFWIFCFCYFLILFLLIAVFLFTFSNEHSLKKGSFPESYIEYMNKRKKEKNLKYS